MNTQKKGFTLIELLIVIGILAVLATVVVLVLNPAQLFAQARDSRRVEDLNSIRSAINFYLTTVSSPDLASPGANCIGEAAPQFGATISSASSTFTGATTQSTSTLTNVTGTGWVPINFASTSGGSPLSALPNDPLNPDTTTYNYQYACNQSATTFELNANMESTRYASSGTDDVESTDGGNVVATYEVGNDPGLDL